MDTTTDITTGSVAVFATRSGYVVGIATGDYDECGTEYETIRLDYAVILDDCGEEVSRHPSMEVEVAGWTDDPLIAADYICERLDMAQDRANRAENEARAAEEDLQRWTALYDGIDYASVYG